MPTHRAIHEFDEPDRTTELPIPIVIDLIEIQFTTFHTRGDCSAPMLFHMQLCATKDLQPTGCILYTNHCIIMITMKRT